SLLKRLIKHNLCLVCTVLFWAQLSISFVFGQRNSLPYLNDSAQFEKLDQAISYYKRRNDSYSLARIYEMKAIGLEENSTRSSSQYFEKALTFYTKLNRQEKVLELHEKLANFYYDLSDYRQALTHAYATLEFYESGTDTMKLAQVYSLIGSLYDDLNEPDQSFEFQH